MNKLVRIVFPLLFAEDKFKFWIYLLHRMENHKYISEMIRHIILYKFNCDISAHAQIDSTCRFPHPIGIVIGRDCIVGGGQ